MSQKLLSPIQIAQFKQDGFLILPDFVAAEECDRLVEEADRLVAAFDPDTHKTIFSSADQSKHSNRYFFDSADQIHFFFEPNAFTEQGGLRQDKKLSINKIGHGLHDLNPVFDSFSRQKKLQGVCNDLGLHDPLLIQSMYIFKQPRIGAEVLSHQDATYLYTDPMTVTGFWFALQDATLSNGCLYALPGGHRLGLKRKFIRNGMESVSLEELDSTALPTDGFVPLEAKKGSLVLLHALLPHRSGPNLSDRSRHAYTLHVIERNAHYPTENWLQRRPDFPALGF